MSANWAPASARGRARRAEGERPARPARAMHSSAITCSLGRGRRRPARSTTAPQTTLPTAPASTTSAALMRRLVRRHAVDAVEEARQPGPDRRDDDQLRRAADADPQHGARARQRLDDVRAPRSPASWSRGRAAASSVHGAVVAHLQVQQRQHQARHADHAEGGLPAPARGDQPAEHHAEHRADRGRRRRSPPAARRACAPESGSRSAPRRPSRSPPRRGRPRRAPPAAGRSCA